MPSKLSNVPQKGTRDWEPEEFAIRHYIFETWRRVNCQFGYQEYLTPLLESAEIYRAKSGEDVGGKELLTMVDRAGRELAIRPEMTPSVTRMVSRYYRQAPKPLRLFSIANFWRNERPQRGRNREFWQLNSDIFGSESVNADIEVLLLALRLMLAFNPPVGSFTLYINHRQLIDAVLSDVANVSDEVRLPTVRLLDKFDKIGNEKFRKALTDLGLAEQTIDQLTRFMETENATQLIAQFPELAENPGYQQISHISTVLDSAGFGSWYSFNPSIIRGFDYYDGMVFEMFDNHPENNRAMFGGGRYNGLADLFVKENIPAVGFAPGDETTRLFLESWNIIPNFAQANLTLYLPLLDPELTKNVTTLANELRQAGYAIEQGIEPQSMKQALSYANRQQFLGVLILGQNEATNNTVSLKTMQDGKQETLGNAALLDKLATLGKN